MIEPGPLIRSDTPSSPGDEAAGARPNDEVDVDARPVRLVERLDHLGVDQRVDLEHDAGRVAGTGGGRLALDHLESEEPRPQRHRRDEQAPEHALAGEAGQDVEQVRDVGADLLAGR